MKDDHGDHTFVAQRHKNKKKKRENALHISHGDPQDLGFLISENLSPKALCARSPLHTKKGRRNSTKTARQ